MEDYGYYTIFQDISEIKRMCKQCVPGVPPQTPGYEANPQVDRLLGIFILQLCVCICRIMKRVGLTCEMLAHITV